MPKGDFLTGPTSHPFSLLEDMIILCAANPFIRRIFLKGKEYVSGSPLTL